MLLYTEQDERKGAVTQRDKQLLGILRSTVVITQGSKPL